MPTPALSAGVQSAAISIGSAHTPAEALKTALANLRVDERDTTVTSDPALEQDCGVRSGQWAWP